MESLEKILARADVGVLLFSLSLDAFGKGAEVHFTARMNEEGHREPSAAVVVRVDDSVRGTLQDSVGEVLEHVAGIDNDLTIESVNGPPGSVPLK